jgi:hypothetical protein
MFLICNFLKLVSGMRASKGGSKVSNSTRVKFVNCKIISGAISTIRGTNIQTEDRGPESASYKKESQSRVRPQK